MKLLNWYNKAGPKERGALADALRTSLKTLYHYATKRRSPSAGVAQRIELATGGVVRAGDLCSACKNCKYYNRKG